MSRLVNRYDGVCSLKKHRPLDGDGNPIPFYEYKQLEDAVKVPAGEGFVFKAGRGWLTICAECKTQQDERRAAKRTAKAQAKVAAAAEAVQANEQAVETVFSHPEGTEIVLIDSSDKPSIARGDAVADCIVPATVSAPIAEAFGLKDNPAVVVAETVVPDVIEKPKHKPFTEGVEGLDSLFG